MTDVLRIAFICFTNNAKQCLIKTLFTNLINIKLINTCLYAYGWYISIKISCWTMWPDGPVCMLLVLFCASESVEGQSQGILYWYVDGDDDVFNIQI